MTKPSIFQQQSQELLKIYEEAGNQKKVLIVAIDYAKKEHTVMFCNGNGDILRKPFEVHNTANGFTYLIEQVRKSTKYHKIKTQHVFFGGEDCGPYKDNFVHALREQGWLVSGVNAADAKTQRENAQASTDNLDLLWIAHMLINRRGNCAPCQSGQYQNLRILVRHRRKLVRLTTEQRNRMHCVVDRLFPGFLDESKSGLKPFGKGSLALMKKAFSADQIKRRRSATLVKQLDKSGVHQSFDKAKTVQAYAATVLHAPNAYIPTLQTSLEQHVALYRCLAKSIEAMEREIAVVLAQTQGVFLTTIRGTGLVLAAGVSAEIGNPLTQKPVSNLTSYAGVIPRVFQTGGSESAAYIGSVSRRCNRILKDYLVQSASHQGLQGTEDLKADYHRRQANHQHADFGIARRYLRIAMHLMRNSCIYLPERLQNGSSIEDRRTYYLELWPYLLEKWKRYHAHEIAFAPENPLGQWRHMIQEIYDIPLSLK